MDDLEFWLSVLILYKQKSVYLVIKNAIYIKINIIQLFLYNPLIKMERPNCIKHSSNHPQDSTQKIQSVSNQSPLINSLLETNKEISMLLIKLLKTYRQLRVIQFQKNISEAKIQRSFEKGLKLLFSIDGKSFLEKGKQLFQICQRLVFKTDQLQDSKHQHLSNIGMKQKQSSAKSQVIEQRPKEKYFKQQPGNKKSESIVQKPVKTESRHYFQKEEIIRHTGQQAQKQKIQQKVKKNPYQEVDQQEYLNNPYCYQNSDEANQKIQSIAKQSAPTTMINKQSQILKLSLPAILQPNPKFGIQVNGYKVQKVSETKYYQNIYTKQSLKLESTLRLKFRVITLGTLAIGLLTAPFKKHGVAEDRTNTPVLKYIVFQNGQGKIILCGQHLLKGFKVGLKNNATLQMIINFKKMKVTFINDILGPYEVTLPSSFKDYPLYLFLEMKHQNTCIQFL